VNDPAAVIARLVESATGVNADVLGAGAGLYSLSAEFAQAGLVGPAVDAIEAEIAVLTRFAPSQADQLTYASEMADARSAIIVRLIAARQTTEAATAAPAAIAAWTTYAALPGADVLRASNSLGWLSSQLSSAGQAPAAWAILRAEVGMLGDFRPSADQPTLAGDALRDLAAREIAAGHVVDAGSVVDTAITSYLRGLGSIQVSVLPLARELGAEARQLWTAGSRDNALAVQGLARAATAGRDLTAPPQS
jgi:hypothetical protein